MINFYANFCVFHHSVFSFFLHWIPLSFFRYFILIIFFSSRTLVTRIPTAKITQLASLDSLSRDINACVLLDSRENVVKRVWVQVNTWDDVYERFFLIFNAGMTTVLQLVKGAWICRIVDYAESFQKKISYYILLSVCNVSFVHSFKTKQNEKFSLYFVLSACLLVFSFFFYLQRSTPLHGKMRAVHVHVVCLIH